MTSDPTARLAPYIPAPTRQNKILAFVRAAGRPLILREIAEGVGMEMVKVSTPLARLVDKGELAREKIVITSRSPRWGGTQRNKTWLYRAAANDDSSDQQGTTTANTG
jgi:DNA-binding IclR family transcriptional regulator